TSTLTPATADSTTGLSTKGLCRSRRAAFMRQRASVLRKRAPPLNPSDRQSATGREKSFQPELAEGETELRQANDGMPCVSDVAANRCRQRRYSLAPALHSGGCMPTVIEGSGVA